MGQQRGPAPVPLSRFTTHTKSHP
eukprot:COSAG06_NODE_150_length_22019_cov_17.221031_1_plen_23_part_10